MLNKKITGFLLLVFAVIVVSCGGNNDNKSLEKPIVSEEQILKKSVGQYPDSLLLIESLIKYYRNNGNYDSAISVTDNALQRDLQNVELWDFKGTLHYENGDTLQSINAYETAINIYPLPEYIISLGTLYAQKKNAKALLLADALLTADKPDVKKEALFIKGLYYTYTSNYIKAIAYFDSCINVDYTYMFAYREKAVALYELEKYEEALKVLTRAITFQNNFDEGYYWMGRCYEKLHLTEQAIESYQMALLYDKHFIEAKEALEKLGVKEAKATTSK